MITLKNIHKRYLIGKSVVHALNNVSLTIEPGEFVAIMGPSGSGKSTLLHVLGFLDRPDEGSYILAGKNVSKLDDEELAVLRNHLVGFVFQQFHLLSRATSLDNVSLPLIYGGKQHDGSHAQKLLKDVGLSHRIFNRSNELSGGEQQRVAIARALVNNPLIIFADEPTGNLDSKSEEEIMSIIEQLHASGKTVIMVTHEDEIGNRAQRVIRMRDGAIISDKKKNGHNISSTCPVAVPFEALISESHFKLGKARFIDHFKQAMIAITSHAMRSLLSMLGILIGVAAVIAMLALGKGAEESIKKNLSSLGSNLLSINPGSHRMHGVSMQAGEVTRFTLKDAEEVARLTQYVRYVSPVVNGGAQLVNGNKNWRSQVYGANEDYAPMRSYIPTQGRFFNELEIIARKKVAVIGTTVAKELFGEQNPVGRSIKINRINFAVLGLLPKKGSGGWRDQDDVVIIPVTTAMFRVFGKEFIDSIDVEIADPTLMQEAKKVIGDLITKRHPQKTKNEDSFEIRDMTEIQQAVSSTTRTMTVLLGSIAAISLLVGGIGIMNIMLVSVTERTREIGLRKAIGAGKRDILTQFLIEAVVMSTVGGLLGIALGASVSFLISFFASWTTKVTIFSVVLATGFSITVGIAFGIWPARKAATLNPIEALRYE